MNIGFIGTGKISRALVEALGVLQLKDIRIHLSPRNKGISEALAGKYEIVTRRSSNQDVIDNSEVLFIALRPNVCKEVLDELNFTSDHTVISLIPYLGYEELADLVEPANRLSRAIPLPTVVNHICPIPVYNPDEIVLEILDMIGQPLEIKDEKQLHTIWALTGLITPFYDLMGELSNWAVENDVKKHVADKYIADMFQSLSYAASISDRPDFKSLSHHAATPGGMNEKSGIEIREAGAHIVYRNSADGILEMFRNNK